MSHLNQSIVNIIYLQKAIRQPSTSHSNFRLTLGQNFTNPNLKHVKQIEKLGNTRQIEFLFSFEQLRSIEVASR